MTIFSRQLLENQILITAERSEAEALAFLRNFFPAVAAILTETLYAIHTNDGWKRTFFQHLILQQTKNSKKIVKKSNIFCDFFLSFLFVYFFDYGFATINPPNHLKQPGETNRQFITILPKNIHFHKNQLVVFLGKIQSSQRPEDSIFGLNDVFTRI